MKSFIKEKGITLIALIITIIVLIILAGVTISILTGENGILNKTKMAKNETKESQLLEELKLKIYEIQTEKNGTATLEDVIKYFDLDEQNEYVISLSEIATIKNNVSDFDNLSEIYVLYKDYQFRIDSNLNITYVGDSKIKDDNANDEIIELKDINRSGCKIVINPNNINLQGTISNYEFYVDDNKIITTNNEYTISNLKVNTNYNIYAVCYDNLGNSFNTNNILLKIEENYEDIIGNLNSGISETGKVFANNNEDVAYYAFDGNNNSYWDGGNINSFIGYEFNTPTECDHIKISQPYSLDVIKDFLIQYSDDNISYYDASNTLTFIRDKSEQSFNLNANLGKHKYWRYKNLNNYTTFNYCAISEIKFCKTTRTTVIQKFSLTSKTSSNIHENGKVFASNNEEVAYYAFDGNNNSYWNGGNINSFIGYEFNTPTECNYVKISQPYSSDVIKDFLIQYSYDNINYYYASDILTYAIENKEQEFDLNENLGKHKYWRYKNLNNYTTNNYCAISELEFLKITQTSI